MKKLLLLIFTLVIATSLFGQSVDVSNIEPEDIDLSKVDLSNVQLYFQGPMELYVSGVRYGNNSYAAILDHDGAGNISVKVPSRATKAGKPKSVDLTGISFQFVSDGLRVSNVVIDGYEYSGKFVMSSNTTAKVASYSRGTKAEEGVRVVERTKVETKVDTAKVNQLQNKVSQLENQVSDKDAEITRLERQLKSARQGIEEPDYMSADDRLSRRLLTNFSGGSQLAGNWSASSSRLSQNDSAQKYAKYVIPLRQSSSELLYKIRGNASGSGWRGFGLHFLGSGSENKSAYGYGTSYLVWVTRDVATYQNDDTYVQLYKSMDDVHMVEVSSKAIDSSISSPMGIEVYVNRNSGEIVVSANGNMLFSFEDNDMIRSGSDMAFRTLGTARFSNIEVKSR